MDASTIAVAVSLGLVAFAILGMALFGVKNLVTGKHEWSKIAILVVPFIVFGVAYGVTGSADEAAMLTTLIMLGFMGVLIALSAVKSVFNF